MRVVAATRILDEADIVEAFVRHTSAFVSHHVFMDNGSRDGTIEILRSLADEGLPITVFQNSSVSINERTFNTFLFRHAVSDCAADWVVFLDADEFIDDREAEGGFLATLGRFHERPDGPRCVKIEMVNYTFDGEYDGAEIVLPRSMVLRFPNSSVMKVIVHGSMAAHDVVVDYGAHHIHIDGVQPAETVVEPSIMLAHYPERSPYQCIVKYLRGWAKVVAAGPAVVATGVSYHYAGPFALLRDRPEALIRDEEFMTRRLSSQDLKRDPIAYRGGEPRYTKHHDETARALRAMIGYLESLAAQHGRLVEASGEAAKLVESWNGSFQRII